MKIVKVLNHNSIVAKDNENREMILIGKGIAYGLKRGDEVNPKLIDKEFALIDTDSTFKSEFKNIFDNLEDNELEATLKIIEYAKQKITGIDDTIYLTLADHIHGIKERVKKGVIHIINPLKYDIKSLYPEEFRIGLKALEIIDEYLYIQMDDDEAATIAIHFVNACFFRNMTQLYDYVEVIKEVLAMVRFHFQVKFDEDSISYFRFASHIKYLAQKIITKDYSINNHINSVLAETIKSSMKDYYACSLHIKDLIKVKYNYEMNENDVLYLCMNLQQVIMSLIK